MLKVKHTTKKGKELLNKFAHYEGYHLWEVYGNYSQEKAQAYEKCKKEYIEDNGEDFHICSHNRYYFSVAWRTEEGYKIKTGQTTYLITF